MTKGFLRVRIFVNNCPFSIIRSEDRVMVARLDEILKKCEVSE